MCAYIGEYDIQVVLDNLFAGKYADEYRNTLKTPTNNRIFDIESIRDYTINGKLDFDGFLISNDPNGVPAGITPILNMSSIDDLNKTADNEREYGKHISKVTDKDNLAIKSINTIGPK